jgi:hypothetical protein
MTDSPDTPGKYQREPVFPVGFPSWVCAGGAGGQAHLSSLARISVTAGRGHKFCPSFPIPQAGRYNRQNRSRLTIAGAVKMSNLSGNSSNS